MPNGNHVQSDVFFVHQEGVFAKIRVEKTLSGWSVHVFEVRQLNGTTVRFGHGLGVAGTADDAREAGVRSARSQIAATLGRKPDESGHVLRAMAQPSPGSSDHFDAYIEVTQSDEVIHRHLMAPVPSRPMTAPEAVEFAGLLLRHVSGVRPDGTLVIGA
ncbi:hypothetical protein [Xanthomonas citri]|uniref:hypothetical protein n=1 Tax=Xanthomonas citri TaxID=346 RepID=UPI001CBF31A0|nr:hypothetical protein [Xanthomonas citri]